MAKRAVETREDATQETLHPRKTARLLGREVEEQYLLSLMHSGKLPHALMLTGPRGIGKATLAYHLARTLLTPQNASELGLFGDPLPADTLFLDPEHPVFRRVVMGSHTDLLVLEGDSITIDAARRVPEFLALTPAESEYRVVIIDSIDAMNRNAANALLKVLEEPPARAHLILISHTPGILLPTIRSRCVQLRVGMPDAENFSMLVRQYLPELTPEELRSYRILAAGSPGLALQLAAQKAAGWYEEMLSVVQRSDIAKRHAFAERLARKGNEQEWQLFSRLIPWMLARLVLASSDTEEVFAGEAGLLRAVHRTHTPASWPDVYDSVTQLLRDAEQLHLDKKQSVLTLLAKIAP